MRQLVLAEYAIDLHGITIRFEKLELQMLPNATQQTLEFKQFNRMRFDDSPKPRVHLGGGHPGEHCRRLPSEEFFVDSQLPN